MLRFPRPTPPASFAKDVGAAARAARGAIAARSAPDFPDLWGKYRRHFVVAQHGKCGYCETFSLNHPAHVEHLAPKSAVQDLVVEGVEAEHLSNVRGRTTPEISATGYYWLAYAWDNWLFACERCNSGWKRCLFPVREVPHPCPPGPRRRYTPLLLSPYGPEDPALHLEFSQLGEVIARNGSPFGDATIRTLGFHLRGSLCRARRPIAADACRHVDRLLLAFARGDVHGQQSAVQDLLSLGAEDRAHAGMVRSIVLSRLKHDWRDLARLAKRLGVPVPSAPRPKRVRSAGRS